MREVRCFLRDERGQDVVEYTLLLAFVTMASAALFLMDAATINTVLTATNNMLSCAAGKTS